MGTDCFLVTETKRVELDRLYVFESEIKTGVEYSREEFIVLLDKLTVFAEQIGDEDAEYSTQWLKIARDNAGHRNVIYSEHDEGSNMDRLPLP